MFRIITEKDELYDLIVQGYQLADEFWQPLDTDERAGLIQQNARGVVNEAQDGTLLAFMYAMVVRHREGNGPSVRALNILTGYKTGAGTSQDFLDLLDEVEAFASKRGVDFMTFYTRRPASQFSNLGFSVHARLMKKAI